MALMAESITDPAAGLGIFPPGVGFQVQWNILVPRGDGWMIPPPDRMGTSHI